MTRSKAAETSWALLRLLEKALNSILPEEEEEEEEAGRLRFSGSFGSGS